jgi:hypothetical protein
VRTSLVASLAFILAGPVVAQSPPTWSRTFGGAVAQQGLFDLRELPGGQLAVAGYTGSFGGFGTSSWLLHLDAATGDVQAQHVASNVMGGFTDGAALAADGGALFLGRTVLDIFVKHDAWLLRLDGNGAVAWTQGFTRPGTGKHSLLDAAELADGSWIAVGATSLVDQPPQAGWVVRLAADGSLLWQFEYSGGAAEVARAVTPTADGGFAVAGWTNSSGAGSDDVWILKLDGAGTIQWQRSVGGLDADQATDIVALDGGGLAVVGSTNSLTPSGHAPWILRLDGAGQLLWHRVIADDVWGDLGAAARTPDGQLVVVGRVAEPGFPSNDLWCAKLDVADGRILWQRAYEGDEGDFGQAVRPLDDGFLAGGTWGWGFASESVWVQRTDRAGGIAGCGLVRTTKFSPMRPAVTFKAARALQGPAGAETQLVHANLGASDADVIVRCR